MAYSGAYGARERREDTAETAPVPEPSAPTERQTVTGDKHRPRPSFDLGALFSKTEAVGMETDDLLMALILYLMYRESGDTDLLVMLGVMLLT